VEHIGSVQVGKRADLVLWNPAFFGAATRHVEVSSETYEVGRTVSC
jgi:urease alpha subunit